MFSNQMFVLIVLQYFILVMVLLFPSAVNGKAIYGDKVPCDIKDHSWFALVYNKREVCGGAVMNIKWVLLAASCLISKIGKRHRKWVRVGPKGYYQYRRVDQTKVCREKHKGCDFAVVRVAEKFKLGKHVKRATIPDHNKVECSEGTYVYTTYPKPYKHNYPLAMYCAKIALRPCDDDDDDYCGTANNDPDYYADEGETIYSDVGKGHPRPTTTRRPRPTRTPTTSEPLTTKEHHTTHRHSTHSTTTHSGNGGVCSDNSGGPLMCEKCVLGFLLGYTCESYVNGEPSNLLGFTKMTKYLEKLSKMTGLSMRSLSAGDEHNSRGRSLHNSGQMKFLWTAMVALLFIFIY